MAKKTAKKASAKTVEKPSFKLEKSSIIVLAIAAVVFVGALVAIYSEDFLEGSHDLFWEYGEEQIDFETARVTEILSTSLESVEEVGAYSGNQELAVIVESGRYQGERMVVYNYVGPLSGFPAAVNDSVTLTIKTKADGQHTATVYEINRIPLLIVLVVLFSLVVVVVGRLTGFKSLIGLAFTCVCLFVVLIPLILKGVPTILTTFIVCAYIALVSFVILGGVHRKTISAFLGTTAGMLLAMVFGLGAQFFGKIDGLRLEDAEPLYQLVMYADFTIDIRGLLVASIIICALGAVMDVAMSISSALEEIHAANPALTRKELFESGMNVGRDMAGTMTNTLILAFLGSEFTLIIFFYARGLTFTHLFSTAFVALETISGLSSSIGMILAIPLTAIIASTLITRGKAGK